MNQFIKTDAWRIIEDRFTTERVKSSESLFSIGNGAMGGRANFEEMYSGDTLRGSYVGGVYYPDKTRVGWWKNGYPEYFAKVLNSAFWIGINVEIGGEQIDLAKTKVLDFYRELDMQHGTLTRRMKIETSVGIEAEIEVVRFISLACTELGAISYSVTPLNGDARVSFTSYIDADVHNEDANYNDKFWEKVRSSERSITMRTKKTAFEVCWAMNNVPDFIAESTLGGGDELISETLSVDAQKGVKNTLYKYVGVCSSMNHQVDELERAAAGVAHTAVEVGFDALLAEHRTAWESKWASCDIEIVGDTAAQQGIRYCIFMLLQTYTGQDNRLNIGPKGFTGEKYGGSTYWDTEAYCIPFYMATAGEDVAKELLKYRYNQLDKAIENATKLGFKGGAALYPMVTMNGEECHNEWEITFEEIHRNGAIAYAIFNYVRYTGDERYLADYGLEVLLGIARFWAQRITFSKSRGKYVMLGVTGPNEYENNVNNNWYTNYIACWCLRYAAEAAQWVERNAPQDYARIVSKCNFDQQTECEHWSDIYDNMHLPYDSDLGVILQQDGYMDKEQILVRDLPESERPINQKWSWDRILRSCYIKQADVLQGIYFFQDDFDLDTTTRNFHFYEQRTVHESSLSPCVHAILAAKIGDMEIANKMYLRTSRLDLDDYNREIEEGLHITSMAGSWLSVVEGFGGMKIRDGKLHFKPMLPENWESMSFKVNFRGRVVKLSATHQGSQITVESGDPIEVVIEENKKN